MVQPEVFLQNQIQAAQLSETLIEEIRQTDSAHEAQLSELKTTCQSLQVHSATMMDQKKVLGD